MRTIWTIIMLSAICIILSSTVFANPLTDAIGNGDIDAVRTALKKGGNVNSKGPGNTPALHMAISQGQLDIARLLIEKGAKLGARDDMGSTALHEAAYRQYLDILKLLMEKGAKVVINMTRRKYFLPPV